jgi:2-oxoglutarate ferredoxin oxidoreductase subunit beta
MFGSDEVLDVQSRTFSLDSYLGAEARWCPSCGDHAVLTAVQRICRDQQLAPEKVVAVSGIGCASRFPHYMHTYGFHGLHGRALPVACGVKARRPDLTVWVATGDGDCCSIGAGHWIHAIRYNMDMTVMLFDNAVYGLTKKQTSPTSPIGMTTNTHPRGAVLPPLNSLQATLGFSNVSFVAQTVDWNPIHLHATLELAYHHRGTSFVRILQRCPTYSSHIFDHLQKNPDEILLMAHDKGVQNSPAVRRIFKNQLEHDPSDMDEARKLADREDRIPIGLFYQNEDAPCYDDITTVGMHLPVEDKIAGIEAEFDRFAV